MPWGAYHGTAPSPIDCKARPLNRASTATFPTRALSVPWLTVARVRVEGEEGEGVRVGWRARVGQKGLRATVPAPRGSVAWSSLLYPATQ